MTEETSRTTRRAFAAMASLDHQLGVHERARLRATLPGQFDLNVTAILASAAPLEDMLEPARKDAWETVVRALGNLRVGGDYLGGALARTGYPRMRMTQLLTTSGEALRALATEAIRWLEAHGVLRVQLGELLALLLADAYGETDTHQTLRDRMALDYVRQEASRASG